MYTMQWYLRTVNLVFVAYDRVFFFFFFFLDKKKKTYVRVGVVRELQHHWRRRLSPLSLRTEGRNSYRQGSEVKNFINRG
jgi:hypothetical protein